MFSLESHFIGHWWFCPFNPFQSFYRHFICHVFILCIVILLNFLSFFFHQLYLWLVILEYMWFFHFRELLSFASHSIETIFYRMTPQKMDTHTHGVYEDRVIAISSRLPVTQSPWSKGCFHLCQAQFRLEQTIQNDLMPKVVIGGGGSEVRLIKKSKMN